MTDRTRRMLAYRSDGLSLEQIARRLYVSRRTVISELGIARVLLGARNGTHAVALAIRAGII